MRECVLRVCAATDGIYTRMASSLCCNTMKMLWTRAAVVRVGALLSWSKTIRPHRVTVEDRPARGGETNRGYDCVHFSNEGADAAKLLLYFNYQVSPQRRLQSRVNQSHANQINNDIEKVYGARPCFW
jgi:hypothetical protein